MIVVSTVLIVLGVLFLVASTIGLLRLPDLYTRAHAVAKSETLGLLLLFGGLLLRPELQIDAAFRLSFVLVASLILNPTAVHALIRAAHRSGALPVQTVDQAGADREIQQAIGDDAVPTDGASGDEEAAT
ncbi:MAG: monovalent cation/H(+) antiporter subunit G [Actinobacteria bacterium]|jgi:multicomponent Na+:H+ antiporter subunit G|nr:monovalent cation/H(+) antiporter subunit G [Actinomycetota bacterium]